MERYDNTDGDSDVLAYQTGANYIIVQFKDGKHTFYKYGYLKPGQGHVEEMKRLAKQGRGLNSYISSNNAVKYQYESRGNSLGEL
ncbi:MAG: hypothetical protein JWN38_267 [Candidatus Saccharibacteria bacterium]|nr:hypothetical protein [Candidatus Saccharibacteria bacterium]